MKAHVSKQTKVGFDNNAGVYFLWCEAGSFLGHHVASNTENPRALAACHRDEKDDPHQESKKRYRFLVDFPPLQLIHLRWGKWQDLFVGFTFV